MTDEKTAAIARHIYLHKDVGIGALRKLYGGRNRRGNRPSHYAPCSASVQRSVCQSLEKLGVLEKSDNGGRRITENGQRDLDQIASQVFDQAKEEAEDEENKTRKRKRSDWLFPLSSIINLFITVYSMCLLRTF